MLPRRQTGANTHQRNPRPREGVLNNTMMRVIPALLLAGLAGAQHPVPSRDVNVYSPEKEVALGAELAKEFKQNSIPLESSAAQQYVERLGRQLAPYLPDQPPFTYTFNITTEAGDTAYLHEPCAFPGGFVFVPAGLFSSAQDEAEFAGMLSHAMAHVAARHETRMARSGQIAEYSSIPLIFMGGRTGTCRADTLLVPAGYLAFARAHELEADELAVKAMAQAGYDPAALARYIRGEQIETAREASAVSPLPPREARLKLLDAAIAALPPATYSQGSAFLRVRQEVRTLTDRLRTAPARDKPSLRR